MTIEQIIERIIEQEIYVNASTMVTDLADCADILPNTMDNLIDCMGAPDYSEPPEGYEVSSYTTKGLPGVPEDRELWQWTTEEEDDDGFSTFREACESAYDHAGGEPETQEALQFWLVSDWLADKLEQVGAPLARDVLGFNVWGRTECGQSLTMDSTLHAVAKLIK